MRRIRLLPLFLLILTVILQAKVSVRIKDITHIKGVRRNQLKGFGLVVGLAGQGDSDDNPLTRATMENLFDALGITIEEEDISTKNVAVVMVTADVNGFIEEGDMVDVQVASVGDAKSLEGGVLLQSALKGGDGVIYAVAQGSVIVPEGKKVPTTVGKIPSGAIVERSLVSDFLIRDTVTFVLREPDFKTMVNIATEITNTFTNISLVATNAKHLTITLPPSGRANVIEFISEIQELEVELDTTARIVIDARTGVVVMGEDVKIASVSVSVAGIKIEVEEKSYVSDEEKKKANILFEDATTVATLVDSLNMLGVDVKDIIHVLTAIKKAGALNAELYVD